MKRGCLIGTVFFGAVAAGYYVLLTPYFEWPANAIVAFFGALFGSMFVSGIVGVLRAQRDAWRMRRAASQQPGALADGATVAISGTIRPLNAPLQAPFSGTPCVAYDYDIVHEGQRASSHGADETYEAYDIAGIALTPSMIDTPHGGVRLLSFALLEEFPQHVYRTPETRERAAAYIASTTFKPLGVTKVFSALGAMSDAMTDDDGAVRQDWRMTQGEIALQAARLRERLVTVGQQVTAIGRYSADRRGLIAEGLTSAIQLRPGDMKEAKHTLLGKAYKQFGVGLLFFAVSHGMLGTALFLSETRYRRETPYVQSSALRIAIQDHDAAKLRHVLRQGADPNVRDSNGDTMLHDLRDPDADLIPVLIAAGADPNLIGNYGYTPLMRAAHMGNDAVLSALIAGGAKVNVVRSNGGTALSDAIEGEHPETVNLLMAAGATSDMVTAENGQPLPAGGGEPMATVRAYLAAIHARNVPGLYAAYTPRPKGFFDGTDFDLWHRIRPQAPELIEGFTTGSVATLAVGGATISKAPYVWHYQLVRQGEVWRIAREWDTSGVGPSTAPAPPPPPPPPGQAEPVERPHARPGEPLERPRAAPPSRP
jgi:hypothetical protein